MCCVCVCYFVCLFVCLFVCRALARNCSAAVNDKEGATAKQWREGKPVRVVSGHMMITCQSCDLNIQVGPQSQGKEDLKVCP